MLSKPSVVRTAILTMAAVAALSGGVLAVDGIAIAHPDAGTPRDDVFGPVVRYDIKASNVVKRSVLYAGGARCVCMNSSADSVAFERQDGSNTWISVMSINGGTPRDLVTNNVYMFYLDWPTGDCIYYNKGWPRGSTPADSSKVFNRVNVKTKSVERVSYFTVNAASDCFWHWQMSTDGMRAAITTQTDPFSICLFDMSQIQPNKTAKLSNCYYGCSYGISPSGATFTHNQIGHQSFWIRDYATGATRRIVNVNTSFGGDHFNWMHYGVNSEDWIITTQGTGTTPDNNHRMMLYHAESDSAILVSNPAVGAAANEWGDDFWAGDPDSKSTTQPQRVEPPALSPQGGNFADDSIKVTITCQTAGASIYYTVNGQDPTSRFAPYARPVVIKPAVSIPVTVKARAYKAGLIESIVASAVYTKVPIDTGKAITLLYPNGGEALNAGQTVTIRWQADRTKTCTQEFLLSLDDGLTYDLIESLGTISCGSAQWGAHAWVIPESWNGRSIATTSARIKVQDYQTPSVNDASDATFTIKPAVAALARQANASFVGMHGIDVRRLQSGGSPDVELLSINGRRIVRRAGDAMTDRPAGLIIVSIRTPTGQREIPMLVR